MKCNSALAILVFAAALLSIAQVSARVSDLDEVKRDITATRYADAEAALVEIARSSTGDDKQEALYLLGGLKRSAAEAEILYREVARLDPSNRWGVAANVELAKIHYAVGEYGTAFDILEDASACRRSDEACYFEGLCAVMLERFGEAKEMLSKVKGDRYRSWASIALAEAEMGMDNREDACRRYRSIARSSEGPTALYRFGECLEEGGEIESATQVFEEVVGRFQNTPEALLAREKLVAIEARQSSPSAPVEEPRGRSSPDDALPLTTGYTLQFGSFHDRTNAIKLAAELKRDLPGVRIDSDLIASKEVHRVRYGFFKSRAEAQRRLEEVARQTGDSCTIMPLP
jgi:tetratricopeptide (TPR) repeat protein